MLILLCLKHGACGQNWRKIYAKKTVSFHQKGKEASFITILDTGNNAGVIKKIAASSYERISIEEINGKILDICVRGMNQKNNKDIRIDI